MDGLSSTPSILENAYILAPTGDELALPELHFVDEEDKTVFHHTVVSYPLHKKGIVHEGPRSHKHHDEETSRTTILGLGMLNAFTGFYNLYYWGKRMVIAIRRGDLESKIESGLRILNAPLAIINAVETIVIFISTFMQGAAILGLSLSALLFGSVFLSIEMALEIYRLYTILHLKYDLQHGQIQKIHSSLQLNDIDDFGAQLTRLRSYVQLNRTELIKFTSENSIKILLETLEESASKIAPTTRKLRDTLQIFCTLVTENKIQSIYSKYFMLSAHEENHLRKKVDRYVEGNPNLDHDKSTKDALFASYKRDIEMGKQDQLARRIGITMIDRFYSHSRVYDLNQKNRTRTSIASLETSGKALLNTLNEQANKSLLVHIIGIVTLTLGGILLAISYLSAPPLGVIFTGAIVMVLQTTRFLAHRSFLDQNGYTFTINPWLHDIKAFFFPEKKVFESIKMKTFKSSVDEIPLISV